MQYSNDASIQHHQVHAYDESLAAERSHSRSLYNTSPSFATRRSQSRPLTASTPVYTQNSPYSFAHDSCQRPSSSSSSRLRRGVTHHQQQEPTTMPLPAEEVLEHIELLQEELARREQEESQYSQSNSRIGYNYELPYDTRDRTAAAPEDLSYYDYSISSSTAAAIAKSASTDEILDLELKQQDVEFQAHQAEQLRRFQQLEVQQRRVHEEQREKARKEQALRDAFDSRVADQVYRRSLAAAGGTTGAASGSAHYSERQVSRPASQQGFIPRTTSNPVTPPSLHQVHSNNHSPSIAVISSPSSSSLYVPKSSQRPSSSHGHREVEEAAVKRLSMSDSAPLYASADLSEKSSHPHATAATSSVSTQLPIASLPLALLSSLPPSIQSHILSLENRCADLTQGMIAANDNQQRFENLLRIEQSFRDQLKESSKTRIQELKNLLEEAENKRDELKAKDAVRMMQETVAETDQSEAMHAATSALNSAADERESLQKEISTLKSSINLEQAHSAAMQTHIQSLEERLLVEKGHVAQLETSNRSLQRQIQELLLKFQVQQAVMSSTPTSPAHHAQLQIQPLSPPSASMYATSPASPFSLSLQQVQLQQNASVDELNRVMQTQQTKIENLQADIKAQMQKLEEERAQSVSRTAHFESTRQSLEHSLTVVQEQLARSHDEHERDRAELARVRESLTKAERELRNAEMDVRQVRDELEREKALAKSIQQQQPQSLSSNSALVVLEQKLQQQYQQHQDEITRLHDSHDAEIAQLQRDHVLSISELQQTHTLALSQSQSSSSPPSSPARVHSSLIQSMQSSQQKRDAEHLAGMNELRRVHSEEISRLRLELLQSSQSQKLNATVDKPLAAVPESDDVRSTDLDSRIATLTADLDSLRREKQSLSSQLESLNRSDADLQQSSDNLSNEKKSLEQNNRQLLEKHESNEKRIKLMVEEATANEHLIRTLQKEQQRASTIQYSTSPPSRVKSLSPLVNSGAAAPLPPLHPNIEGTNAPTSLIYSANGTVVGVMPSENESPDMPVFTSVTAGGGTLGVSAGYMSESELASTRQSPAGYNLMRLEADATPVSPYHMYDQSAANIEALHDSYNHEISLLQKKNTQLQQLNELSISLLKEEETKRKEAEKSIVQLQTQIQSLERSMNATPASSASGLSGSDLSLANSTSTSSLSSLPTALSAQSTARSVSTGSNTAAPTSSNPANTINNGSNPEWPSTVDSLQILELQKDRERLSQDLQSQSTELQKLQQRLVEKDKELATLRASFESLTATSTVDIEHLQQHIESLTNEYNTLAQRWESLRAKYEKVKKARKEDAKKLKEEEKARASARTEAREAALATVAQHKGDAELLAVDVEYLMQEIITLQKENEKLQVAGVVASSPNGNRVQPVESPNSTNDSMTDSFSTPQKTPLKQSNLEATPLAPNNFTATPLAPSSLANGASVVAMNTTTVNSVPLIDMTTPRPPSNQY